MQEDTLFTVPELARDLGITPRTIRFYESKGLLSPARAGTTRIYARADRARLQLILRGKRLGFSLAEIKEYLELYQIDPSQDEQIRHLIRRVRARIDTLSEQREIIETTLQELMDIERQAYDALGDPHDGAEAPTSDNAKRG